MERGQRETTPNKADHVTVVQPGERPPQRPPPPPRSSEGIVVAGGPRQWVGPPPPARLFYKTKVCVNYETTGRCMFGEHCAFAHGVAELRRPDVDMGHQVCHNFMYTGTCYYGDRCIFSHALSAPGPGLAIPGRAFPPVHQMPDQEQEAGACRVSNLERLSRKKTRGIYGDWPEQN